MLITLIHEHAAFESAPLPSVTAPQLMSALFGDSVPLQCWIAQTGGESAGYLTATRDFSTWTGRPFLNMDCLYVAAHHRNTGIGAALFEALRHVAQQTGIVDIQWQTPHWNADAARFYRRLGAEEQIKRRFTFDARRKSGAV
ncbi:MAG: GNAT family N-acetyltransferase [Tahibacter sp.]